MLDRREGLGERHAIGFCKTLGIAREPGEIKNFTGVDDPYEEPAAAEIVVEKRVGEEISPDRYLTGDFEEKSTGGGAFYLVRDESLANFTLK